MTCVADALMPNKLTWANMEVADVLAANRHHDINKFYVYSGQSLYAYVPPHTPILKTKHFI